MTAKVTISLPEDLLARLDGEAGTLGRARSDLVQESLVAYLGKTAEERAAEARLAGMREAIEHLRTMFDGVALLDDRPTLDILREVRGTDDRAGRELTDD